MFPNPTRLVPHLMWYANVFAPLPISPFPANNINPKLWGILRRGPVSPEDPTVIFGDLEALGGPRG